MFIKVSLEDLDPIAIVFLRTLLGTLVLAPVALSSAVLTALRGRLGWVAAIAAAQIAVPFLLITIGEERISSSLTAILVSSAPIFTALLAVRFDAAERSRGWRLVGVLAGIGGVALLFGFDLAGTAEELLGGLAVLLAGLCYAVGALLAKHRMRDVPPVGVAASTMAASCAMLLPLLPFALPDHAPALDTVGSMVVLGAGGTGLAFLIFYTLIADVGPARATLVTYVAPGFSIVYGALLLDEAITVVTIGGLALILAGSYLAADGRLPWRSTGPVTEAA